MPNTKAERHKTTVGLTHSSFPIRSSKYAQTWTSFNPIAGNVPTLVVCPCKFTTVWNRLIGTDDGGNDDGKKSNQNVNIEIEININATRYYSFSGDVCVRRACALSHSQRPTSNMPLYRPQSHLKASNISKFVRYFWMLEKQVNIVCLSEDYTDKALKSISTPKPRS